MSDKTKAHWWESQANCGIVGLGELGDPSEDVAWPTHGYDGQLVDYSWDGGLPSGSGHTRAEWLELADAMIARWQAWRARVTALPPETFLPEDA